MPINSQKQITDESDSPVAEPDFIYDGDGMSLLIFVDGPDHDKDSIKADDEVKRQHLDLMGYSYYVIRYDADLDDQIADLHARITS